MLARFIYRQSPANSKRCPAECTSDEAIDSAIHTQQTIEAIERYRARPHCGLKEAKEAIERRARQPGIL